MHDVGLPDRKLLLVAYNFPPYNSVSAVRTGKMARYLIERGWDIRVLTADRKDAANLKEEVESSIVTRTDWHDMTKAFDEFVPKHIKKLGRILKSRSHAPTADTASRWLAGKTYSALKEVEHAIVQWPDKRAGWRRPALKAGQRILSGWKPNFIYATAPPFTSLLVADRLSRLNDIPWVCEFRDLWVDDPYYEYGAIRRSIERLWERRVVGRAVALVTVSTQWRDLLAQRFKKPVALIMNGYDPNDLPMRPPSTSNPTGPLRILHTGSIYTGYRDPTPLFQAISLLGAQRNDVIVEFVGTNVDGLIALARKASVDDRVIVRPPIAYRDSLALQLTSDVLLHLQWNDPKEAGTIGAKLFEYIGARRPVLGIGYESGSVARIIRERNAGIVSNNPSVIAEQLRQWVAAKKSGGVPALPDTAAAGLTRAEQFACLVEFLDDLAQKNRPRPRSPRTTASLDTVGFTRTQHYNFADTSHLDRPVLSVIVDTEEGFDWRKPRLPSNRDVKSLHVLYKGQSICKKWGITPTYVVDHPVVSSSYGQQLIQNWLDAGECEIGAHLHPWVNPPEDEDLSVRNSYPGNLSAELERAKLKVLTEAIERSFGRRPMIYRAGRYGLGPHSLPILEELGYLIDVSVVPFTSYAAESGPDFTGFGPEPMWFGNRRRMLELPVTRGFVGLLRNRNHRHFDKLHHGVYRRLKIAGVLVHSGLLERITLSPEGNTLEEMSNLCRSLFAAGCRVFTFSFHSPSLLPGNTPYVRDEASLSAFLRVMDAFFAFFMVELRGVSASPTQIYKMLDQRLTPEQTLKSITA